MEASLRVPLYEEEMKYFYSNYKNYYYLPEEDTAIHKSVASYVDKAHRVQATAKNCYTRKLSSYLPQWDILFQPFFKRKYEDRDIFFELTEEMKKERTLFSKYAACDKYDCRVLYARIESPVHSPQIDSLLRVLTPLGYTLQIVPIK